MWLELARRVSVIVLSVALATGFMAHAAQSHPHHGQVTTSAAIAGDQFSTGMTGGCPADQTVNVQVTCFATCAGVGALPSLPAIFNVVDPGVLSPSIDLVMIDHATPPDPYPPRPINLS